MRKTPLRFQKRIDKSFEIWLKLYRPEKKVKGKEKKRNRKTIKTKKAIPL